MNTTTNRMGELERVLGVHGTPLLQRWQVNEIGHAAGLTAWMIRSLLENDLKDPDGQARVVLKGQTRALYRREVVVGLFGLETEDLETKDRRP